MAGAEKALKVKISYQNSLGNMDSENQEKLEGEV